MSQLSKEIINSTQAPQAIGPYSQAIKVNDLVFLSGQIPLLPETNQLIAGDTKMQLEQVFRNIAAVAHAAGGSLENIIKLTIFLANFERDFVIVNQVMEQFFQAPYPARSTLGVAALPKQAQVEVDAILSF